jgi:hypothetical protein
MVFGFFNDDYADFVPVTCNRFKKIIAVELGKTQLLQQGRLFRKFSKRIYNRFK